MSFTLLLGETISGEIITQLPATDGGRCTDGPLNDATSGDVTVPVEFLGMLERWQWAPWASSVVVCHTFEGELHPVAAGPILAPPTGEKDFATFTYGGLWSVLDWRLAVAAHYPPDDLVPRVPAENAPEDEGPLADTSRVVTSTAGFRGLSLGAIGWELVQLAQRKPMGQLPVVHGSPYETVADSADRQRTYEGWNVANISAGKLLRELTGVIRGPDIAFRPRWAVPGERIEWVMVHGTEGMPEIAQETHPVIDLTAPRPGAVLTKLTAEYSPAHRVYATGAGEGAGTLIRIHDRDPEQHTPWLETVENFSDTVNPDLLQRDAQSRLREGPIVQLSVSMPVADPLMPLHVWHTGDSMEVISPPGYANLPAGTYRMRVVSRDFDYTSGMVNVEFQPEELLQATIPTITVRQPKRAPSPVFPTHASATFETTIRVEASATIAVTGTGRAAQAEFTTGVELAATATLGISASATFPTRVGLTSATGVYRQATGAPSVRAVTHTSHAYAEGATGARSFPKPAGTVPGDLLIVYATMDTGTLANITPPPGWTTLGKLRYAADEVVHLVAYRLAGTDEPDEYTFDRFDQWADGCSSCVAVAGWGQGPLVYQQQTTTRAQLATPAAVPSSTPALVLWSAHHQNDQETANGTWTWVPPAGGTLVGAGRNVDGWSAHGIASAAATGTVPASSWAGSTLGPSAQGVITTTLTIPG